MPSWQKKRARPADAGVRLKREAKADPMAIPVRKLASIVANACTLPPSTWPSKRVQRTS